MDATYPSAYRYQTYSAALKQQDESPWSSEFLMGDPLTQPMERFLAGQERVPFPARVYERDPTLLPFPTATDNPLVFGDADGSLYSMQQRWPSPSDSGLSSSYSGSDWTDRDQSPQSSPAMCVATYPPDVMYPGHAFYSLGRNSYHKDFEGNVPAHCVTLHEVQQYPDTQPELLAFEDEHHAYGSYAQEGYQPMQVDERCHHDQLMVPSKQDLDVAPSGPCNEQAAATLSHQRSTSTRTPRATKSLTSKVSKRPRSTKRSSSHKKPSATLDLESPTSPSAPTTGSKFFPCPFATYGCTSTFGSKNEWKRHVSSQHMKLGFWRCDQCAPQGDEQRPNDFNRKDLFIQHVRRMHPAKVDVAKKGSTKSKNAVRARKTDEVEAAALYATAANCWTTMRSAPEKCGCLFCDANFEGSNAWDERMEHVGRHFEAAKKGGEDAVELKDWQTDEKTEEWLVQEGLVTRVKSRLMLADLR